MKILSNSLVMLNNILNRRVDLPLADLPEIIQRTGDLG